MALKDDFSSLQATFFVEQEAVFIQSIYFNMTHAITTADYEKVIKDLILAKENQAGQEFLTYTNMVDSQLSDDLESAPSITTKSFILPEPQLTRVTKRHKANRAYFEI